MTANQIAFARHKEESRHNRVSERHEHRSIEQQGARYAEEARHNQETERVNWWSAQEQGRHNQATEATAQFSANALRDFQINQSEALLRQAGVAERRADIDYADLANKYRTSVANARNAATNERNAATREAELRQSIVATNASIGLGYSQLAEQTRAAQAREAENYRSNVANLEELSRHNVATEEIGSTQAGAAETQAAASKSRARTEVRRTTIQSRQQDLAEKRYELERKKTANDMANNSFTTLARSFVSLY